MPVLCGEPHSLHLSRRSTAKSDHCQRPAEGGKDEGDRRLPNVGRPVLPDDPFDDVDSGGEDYGDCGKCDGEEEDVYEVVSQMTSARAR